MVLKEADLLPKKKGTAKKLMAKNPRLPMGVAKAISKNIKKKK